MSDNLHTSLPIEYELKYGTACGNLDSSNFVSKAACDSLGGIYIALPKEKLLCDFWVNPSTLIIDSLDALLVPLNRE